MTLAGHSQPLPLLETPGHSGKSGSVSCGVTAPFSWVLVRTRFSLCPRVCFLVLCKFWWVYGGITGDLLQEGLCHTQVSCTQSPYPCSSPLLTVTSSVQFSSVAQSCLTLCDSVNRSTPGLPVQHQLPEFTHDHQVGDAIQTFNALSSLLLPSIFPRITAFSSELVLHIRWPKYCSFSFNISPSNEHLGLISLGWTGWISLQSKGLSRVFFNTIVQKHCCSAFFTSNSHLYSG